MTSPAVTHADIKSAIRLVGECRELGDDFGQWRAHLLEGLGRLVDADLVLHAALTGVRERQARMCDGFAWGFEKGFNLTGWIEVVHEFGVSLRSEMTQHILTQMSAGTKTGLTLARQAMIPADEWERTFDCQVISRTIGTDAVMQSYHWLAEQGDLLDGMTLGRGRGSRLFDEREEMLVRVVHSEIASLVGGPLAGRQDQQPSQLPPRVRQVLRCMLEGNSDKQIALRLGLSPHTVNQYTKQIYRYFQVAGRAELLARWVRRGWKLNETDWQQDFIHARY